MDLQNGKTSSGTSAYSMDCCSICNDEVTGIDAAMQCYSCTGASLTLYNVISQPKTQFDFLCKTCSGLPIEEQLASQNSIDANTWKLIGKCEEVASCPLPMIPTGGDQISQLLLFMQQQATQEGQQGAEERQQCAEEQRRQQGQDERMELILQQIQGCADKPIIPAVVPVSFSGEEDVDVVNFEHWKGQVRRYADMAHINPLQALGDLLIKQAKVEFLALLDNEKTDFDTAVTTLKDQLQPTRSSVFYATQIAHIQQKEQEPIDDYVRRFRLLVSRSGHDARALYRGIFLRGLLPAIHERIYPKVIGDDEVTLSTIYELARDGDRAFKECQDMTKEQDTKSTAMARNNNGEAKDHRIARRKSTQIDLN